MIQFDLIFGREAVRIEAACFGWLSSANDLDYRLGKIQDRDQRPFAEDFTEGNARPTELVWYPKFSALSEENMEEAWPIVQEVVEAWDWLDDTVMLRKATGAVHVKLGDTPCDKSILCIGIIRNFFMVSSFRGSYNAAKELGATPREAYIFAGLCEYNKDWRGVWSVCTRELWEYDSLNSATFGVNALKEMCKPNYSPWKQDNWFNQIGYDRDHMMRGTFSGFNGHQSRHRLLNVFSIENDKKILNNQLQIYVREDNEELTDILNQIRQAMQA